MRFLALFGVTLMGCAPTLDLPPMYPPEQPATPVRCVPVQIKDANSYSWISLCGEIIPGIVQPKPGGTLAPTIPSD